MAKKHDMVVLLSTAPPDKAAGIAEALVAERLVACVNTLPVQSCYRWKGEICHDGEHLMIIKTTKTKADMVISAIRRIHTYEVPEIIVLPVVGGSAPYLAWVAGETSEQ